MRFNRKILAIIQLLLVLTLPLGVITPALAEPEPTGSSFQGQATAGEFLTAQDAQIIPEHTYVWAEGFEELPEELRTKIESGNRKLYFYYSNINSAKPVQLSEADYDKYGVFYYNRPGGKKVLPPGGIFATYSTLTSAGNDYGNAIELTANNEIKSLLYWGIAQASATIHKESSDPAGKTRSFSNALYSANKALTLSPDNEYAKNLLRGLQGLMLLYLVSTLQNDIQYVTSEMSSFLASNKIEQKNPFIAFFRNVINFKVFNVITGLRYMDVTERAQIDLQNFTTALMFLYYLVIDKNYNLRELLKVTSEGIKVTEKFIVELSIAKPDRPEFKDWVIEGLKRISYNPDLALLLNDGQRIKMNVDVTDIPPLQTVGLLGGSTTFGPGQGVSYPGVLESEYDSGRIVLNVFTFRGFKGIGYDSSFIKNIGGITFTWTDVAGLVALFTIPFATFKTAKIFLQGGKLRWVGNALQLTADSTIGSMIGGNLISKGLTFAITKLPGSTNLAASLAKSNGVVKFITELGVVFGMFKGIHTAESLLADALGTGEISIFSDLALWTFSGNIVGVIKRAAAKFEVNVIDAIANRMEQGLGKKVWSGTGPNKGYGSHFRARLESDEFKAILNNNEKNAEEKIKDIQEFIRNLKSTVDAPLHSKLDKIADDVASLRSMLGVAAQDVLRTIEVEVKRAVAALPVPGEKLVTKEILEAAEALNGRRLVEAESEVIVAQFVELEKLPLLAAGGVKPGFVGAATNTDRAALSFLDDASWLSSTPLGGASLSNSMLARITVDEAAQDAARITGVEKPVVAFKVKSKKVFAINAQKLGAVKDKIEEILRDAKPDFNPAIDTPNTNILLASPKYQELAYARASALDSMISLERFEAQGMPSDYVLLVTEEALPHNVALARAPSEISKAIGGAESEIVTARLEGVLGGPEPPSMVGMGAKLQDESTLVEIDKLVSEGKFAEARNLVDNGDQARGLIAVVDDFRKQEWNNWINEWEKLTNKGVKYNPLRDEVTPPYATHIGDEEVRVVVDKAFKDANIELNYPWANPTAEKTSEAFFDSMQRAGLDPYDHTVLSKDTVISKIGDAIKSGRVRDSADIYDVLVCNPGCEVKLSTYQPDRLKVNRRVSEFSDALPPGKKANLESNDLFIFYQAGKNLPDKRSVKVTLNLKKPLLFSNNKLVLELIEQIDSLSLTSRATVGTVGDPYLYAQRSDNTFVLVSEEDLPKVLSKIKNFYANNQASFNENVPLLAKRALPGVGLTSTTKNVNDAISQGVAAATNNLNRQLRTQANTYEEIKKLIDEKDFERARSALDNVALEERLSDNYVSRLEEILNTAIDASKGVKRPVVCDARFLSCTLLENVDNAEAIARELENSEEVVGKINLAASSPEVRTALKAGIGLSNPRIIGNNYERTVKIVFPGLDASNPKLKEAVNAFERQVSTPGRTMPALTRLPSFERILARTPPEPVQVVFNAVENGVNVERVLVVAYESSTFLGDIVIWSRYVDAIRAAYTNARIDIITKRPDIFAGKKVNILDAAGLETPDRYKLRLDELANLANKNDYNIIFSFEDYKVTLNTGQLAEKLSKPVPIVSENTVRVGSEIPLEIITTKSNSVYNVIEESGAAVGLNVPKRPTLLIDLPPAPYQKYIFVHPFSANKEKEFNNQFWTDLINKLHATHGGEYAFVLSSGAESADLLVQKEIGQALGGKVTLAPQTSSEGFFSLIKNAEMVISADTATVHLAYTRFPNADHITPTVDLIKMPDGNRWVPPEGVVGIDTRLEPTIDEIFHKINNFMRTTLKGEAPVTSRIPTVRHAFPVLDNPVQWPSAVGQIPELTPELERAFQTGGVVKGTPEGGYVLTVPEVGTVSTRTTVVSEGVHDAFLKWKAKNYMPAISLEEAEQVLTDIELFLNRNGIGLEVQKGALSKEEFLEATINLRRLLILLRVIPKEVLQSGVLNKIILNKNPAEIFRGGGFNKATKEAFLFTDALEGPVRNFDNTFMHEVGHAVFESLSEGERKAMSYLSNLIDRDNVFAVDYLNGELARRGVANANVDEFFAETFMHYVLYGEQLTKHIEKLSGVVKESYETIYNILKSKLEGVEFKAKCVIGSMNCAGIENVDDAVALAREMQDSGAVVKKYQEAFLEGWIDTDIDRTIPEIMVKFAADPANKAVRVVYEGYPFNPNNAEDIALEANIRARVSNLRTDSAVWRVISKRVIPEQIDLPSIGAIPETELTDKELLGSGQQAVVNKVRYNTVLFAHKTIPENEFGTPTGEAKLRSLKKEFETLQALSHVPEVAKPFRETTRNGQFSGFLREYVEGDTLQDYLYTAPVYTTSVTQVRSLEAALNDVRESLYVNHDVYDPRNVLVNTRGEIILSDFGLADKFENLQSLVAENPDSLLREFELLTRLIKSRDFLTVSESFEDDLIAQLKDLERMKNKYSILLNDARSNPSTTYAQESSIDRTIAEIDKLSQKTVSELKEKVVGAQLLDGKEFDFIVKSVSQPLRKVGDRNVNLGELGLLYQKSLENKLRNLEDLGGKDVDVLVVGDLSNKGSPSEMYEYDITIRVNDAPAATAIRRIWLAEGEQSIELQSITVFPDFRGGGLQTAFYDTENALFRNAGLDLTVESELRSPITARALVEYYGAYLGSRFGEVQMPSTLKDTLDGLILKILKKDGSLINSKGEPKSLLEFTSTDKGLFARGKVFPERHQEELVGLVEENYKPATVQAWREVAGFGEGRVLKSALQEKVSQALPSTSISLDASAALKTHNHLLAKYDLLRDSDVITMRTGNSPKVYLLERIGGGENKEVFLATWRGENFGKETFAVSVLKRSESAKKLELDEEIVDNLHNQRFDLLEEEVLNQQTGASLSIATNLVDTGRPVAGLVDVEGQPAYATRLISGLSFENIPLDIVDSVFKKTPESITLKLRNFLDTNPNAGFEDLPEELSKHLLATTPTDTLSSMFRLAKKLHDAGLYAADWDRNILLVLSKETHAGRKYNVGDVILTDLALLRPESRSGRFSPKEVFDKYQSMTDQLSTRIGSPILRKVEPVYKIARPIIEEEVEETLDYYSFKGSKFGEADIPAKGLDHLGLTAQSQISPGTCPIQALLGVTVTEEGRVIPRTQPTSPILNLQLKPGAYEALTAPIAKGDAATAKSFFANLNQRGRMLITEEIDLMEALLKYLDDSSVTKDNIKQLIRQFLENNFETSSPLRTNIDETVERLYNQVDYLHSNYYGYFDPAGDENMGTAYFSKLDRGGRKKRMHEPFSSWIQDRKNFRTGIALKDFFELHKQGFGMSDEKIINEVNKVKKLTTNRVDVFLSMYDPEFVVRQIDESVVDALTGKTLDELSLDEIDALIEKMLAVRWNGYALEDTCMLLDTDTSFIALSLASKGLQSAPVIYTKHQAPIFDELIKQIEYIKLLPTRQDLAVANRFVLIKPDGEVLSNKVLFKLSGGGSSRTDFDKDVIEIVLINEKAEPYQIIRMPKESYNRIAQKLGDLTTKEEITAADISEIQRMLQENKEVLDKQTTKVELKIIEEGVAGEEGAGKEKLIAEGSLTGGVLSVSLFCGNGIVNTGEECDKALPSNNPDYVCAADCRSWLLRDAVIVRDSIEYLKLDTLNSDAKAGLINTLGLYSKGSEQHNIDAYERIVESLNSEDKTVRAAAVSSLQGNTRAMDDERVITKFQDIYKELYHLRTTNPSFNAEYPNVIGFLFLLPPLGSKLPPPPEPEVSLKSISERQSPPPDETLGTAVLTGGLNTKSVTSDGSDWIDHRVYVSSCQDMGDYLLLGPDVNFLDKDGNVLQEPLDESKIDRTAIRYGQNSYPPPLDPRVDTGGKIDYTGIKSNTCTACESYEGFAPGAKRCSFNEYSCQPGPKGTYKIVEKTTKQFCDSAKREIKGLDKHQLTEQHYYMNPNEATSLLKSAGARLGKGVVTFQDAAPEFNKFIKSNCPTKIGEAIYLGQTSTIGGSAIGGVPPQQEPTTTLNPVGQLPTTIPGEEIQQPVGEMCRILQPFFQFDATNVRCEVLEPVQNSFLMPAPLEFSTLPPIAQSILNVPGLPALINTIARAGQLRVIAWPYGSRRQEPPVRDEQGRIIDVPCYGSAVYYFYSPTDIKQASCDLAVNRPPLLYNLGRVQSNQITGGFASPINGRAVSPLTGFSTASQTEQVGTSGLCKGGGLTPSVLYYKFQLWYDKIIANEKTLKNYDVGVLRSSPQPKQVERKEIDFTTEDADVKLMYVYSLKSPIEIGNEAGMNLIINYDGKTYVLKNLDLVVNPENFQGSITDYPAEYSTAGKIWVPYFYNLVMNSLTDKGDPAKIIEFNNPFDELTIVYSSLALMNPNIRAKESLKTGFREILTKNIARIEYDPLEEAKPLAIKALLYDLRNTPWSSLDKKYILKVLSAGTTYELYADLTKTLLANPGGILDLLKTIDFSEVGTNDISKLLDYLAFDTVSLTSIYTFNPGRTIEVIEKLADLSKESIAEIISTILPIEASPSNQKKLISILGEIRGSDTSFKTLSDLFCSKNRYVENYKVDKEGNIVVDELDNTIREALLSVDPYRAPDIINICKDRAVIIQTKGTKETKTLGFVSEPISPESTSLCLKDKTASIDYVSYVDGLITAQVSNLVERDHDLVAVASIADSGGFKRIEKSVTMPEEGGMITIPYAVKGTQGMNVDFYLRTDKGIVDSLRSEGLSKGLSGKEVAVS